MRLSLPLTGFAAVALLLAQDAGQQADTPTKSAFETSKKGWDDVLLDQNFWTRVSTVPKGKVATKSPWSVKDDVLTCAAGAKELLLYTVAKKGGGSVNGIFHVEWRLKKGTSGSTGILVRTSMDGSLYH